jgi:hypothetical protein
MTVSADKANRTSLALGWEAARANAVPGFILQGAMLLVLIGYYVFPSFAEFLNRLAHYKAEHGLVFVVIAAAVAGAIVPEPAIYHPYLGDRRHPGRSDVSVERDLVR